MGHFYQDRCYTPCPHSKLIPFHPFVSFTVDNFSWQFALYLLTDSSNVSSADDWYYGFDLAVERGRGLSDREDHFHAATFDTTFQPGESLTFVASTEFNPNLNSKAAMTPRGCIAQAWTVAEVLRAWTAIASFPNQQNQI